jgi:hypothetical protein
MEYSRKVKLLEDLVEDLSCRLATISELYNKVRHCDKTLIMTGLNSCLFLHYCIYIGD